MPKPFVYNHAKSTTGMTEGQIAAGTVTGVDRCGIFVTFDCGESGLVPPHEICWPGQRDAYGLGARVKVLIKKFTPGVGLSLSIKRATQAREFNAFLAAHSVGSTASAVITQVVDYGVFVVLAPGVFGLVHCSSIPDLSVYDLRSIGAKLRVEILAIDSQLRRISLKPTEHHA